MTGVPPFVFTRRALSLGFVVLLIASAVFGLIALLPFPVGLVIGVAGATVGAALRASRSPEARALAPAPPVVTLGLLSAFSPVNLLTELYAGLAGLAFLVWLADEPDRLPGGPARALRTIAIPTLGFGLAWMVSLLVPATGAGLGVAVALLVVVGAMAAFLLRAPEAFDRDPAATS